MKNTRLVQVLKKMEPRELARFGHFVQCGYFTRHRKSQRLAEVLLKAAPGFLPDSLKKETVFALVFHENEPFDDLKFNNLTSDLLALLLDFLAQNRFEEHPTARLFWQMDALLGAEELATFGTIDRRFSIQKKARLDRSADFWRDEAGHFERLDRAFIQSGKRAFDENLQLENDALDRAFALDKLRLACGMISRGQVVNGSYEPHFLPEVKNWLARREDWLDDPVFQIYAAALAMLERLQAVDYQRFVGLLAEHEAKLATSEAFALWHYSLNFCIRQINAGHSDWYTEALRLYRALLERGALFKNGHLSPWAYKNIVTAGLRTRDFEWTACFIDEFREKLPPEERGNAHAYSRAALAFEKKEFASALAALQTVEFTDMGYALGAKIIQLKSWFHKGEEEALFSLIETTKKWLRRQKKMPEYGRRANLNFLKTLRPLFLLVQSERRLRPADYRKKAGAQRKKIAALEPLANREWVEECLR